MAILTPSLDLLYLDNNSSKVLVLADISDYPPLYNIISPTIFITTPSGSYVTVVFSPKNVNIFDSADLGMTCDSDDKVALPDGVYQFKYQIGTATKFTVDRSFMRIGRLQEKFDSAFLKLDLNNCDFPTSIEQKKYLDNINIYIQEAIASANQCALTTANKMYNKASKMLDNFLREGSCK